MADQKRWFKVWTSITSDDDFDPTAPNGLQAVGRFALLGAYTALHGARGHLAIRLATLLRLLDATTLDDIRATNTFKNVHFEEGKNRHGKVVVTWTKWKKYQEDSTQAERQKTSRAKRRGEEKRGEEKRKEEKNGASPGGDAPSPPSLTVQATDLLAFLNEKAGTRFRPRQANGRPTASLRLIMARLHSGATPEQCRGVIAKKIREWKPDAKMAAYLRPETLFGASKFESYLGQ